MRVEVNLTLRCNLRCHNCNRCCNLFPERTNDMSRGQITDLIHDVMSFREETGKPINRIKVVGGEPLLHPEHNWVLTQMGKLVPKYCKKIKVDSNGILEHEAIAGIVFSGRSPKRKAHLPYLWSPKDLGLPYRPCDTPKLCGFSIDDRGWLPCSPAIMIVRSFGLWHLYKSIMPRDVWGLEELCQHCIHAAPRTFKDRFCKPLSEITEQEKTPTISWAKALQDYAQRTR